MLDLWKVYSHKENESKHHCQCRVNPFHSAVVEIVIGKIIFKIFLDKNLSDQITRNYEKDVYTSKPTRNGRRPGVKDNNDTNGYGSETIDVGPVI